MRKSTLTLALFLFTSVTTFARGVPDGAEVALSPGDSKVGSYTSSLEGFNTVSYWIEGPTGLIVIDTQFLPSAAEQLIDWAEKTTGKKIVLAIALHPNPDKFNGTAVFQKHGIRVVTSEQVLKLIPAVHKLRKSWFYDRFKPDYPADEPKPESFGNKTTELQAGGIIVKAHVLGPGCSAAHVVVEYGKHVFVGDLVTQGFHSWLELGLLKEWLNRLNEIRDIEPTFVHTGRGGSGYDDLLDREEKYLSTVIRIVKSHQPKKGMALSEKTSKKIFDEIIAAYPSYDNARFVENGLEAVWAKLAQ